MTHTIQPFGEHALLITLPEGVRPSLVGRTVLTRFGVNARVGLDTVLISGNNLPTTAQLDELILSMAAETAASPARTIEIPVTYNGEDLNEVAAALDMTPESVIKAHLDTTWHVALVGFAPGFPYLVPAETASPFTKVARRATPRTQVPAGSVAVAAGMSAVYPAAMPGGWMLIGHTDTVLFNPQSANPSLLTAGDIVKFVEVRP